MIDLLPGPFQFLLFAAGFVAIVLAGIYGFLWIINTMSCDDWDTAARRRGEPQESKPELVEDEWP